MERTLGDVLSTKLDIYRVFTIKDGFVKNVILSFTLLLDLHLNFTQVRINDVHL